MERAGRYLDLGRPANALADWDRAAALQPLSATERIKFQTFAFCTIGALGLPPARNALLDSATTVSVQSLP